MDTFQFVVVIGLQLLTLFSTLLVQRMLGSHHEEAGKRAPDEPAERREQGGQNVSPRQPGRVPRP